MVRSAAKQRVSNHEATSSTDLGFTRDRIIKCASRPWPTCDDASLRDAPQSLAEKEAFEIKHMSIAFPARGAARSDAPQTRGPGLFQSTGVPGLQRTISRCAAPGTRAHKLGILFRPGSQDEGRADAKCRLSDSSHPANASRKKTIRSSPRSGSQSNVAHHSTKARSPSTTGVTRNVARKSRV